MIRLSEVVAVTSNILGDISEKLTNPFEDGDENVFLNLLCLPFYLAGIAVAIPAAICEEVEHPLEKLEDRYLGEKPFNERWENRRKGIYFG